LRDYAGTSAVGGRLVVIGIVVMIVCIAFFYKAGEMEGRSGLIWGLMSFGVWEITPRVLGYSLVAQIVGQVALFFGIAGFRVLLEEVGKRRSN
jgi:hypothetical protein